MGDHREQIVVTSCSETCQCLYMVVGGSVYSVHGGHIGLGLSATISVEHE